jgi:hypothetical protein
MFMFRYKGQRGSPLQTRLFDANSNSSCQERQLEAATICAGTPVGLKVSESDNRTMIVLFLVLA